ncbi:hypothetical protein [Syntrophorhabdus aromaticivorans]|nr:hypothetical protein [Syntrophorhabdus aromaticivorans]
MKQAIKERNAFGLHPCGKGGMGETGETGGMGETRGKSRGKRGF